MNREIRFRAWHNRKMLYHNPMMSTHDFIITPDGKVFYTDEPGYVNGKNHDSVIMQYTGLKDKNSKEIYEGDVIRKDNPSYWNDTDEPPDAEDMNFYRGGTAQVVAIPFGFYMQEIDCGEWCFNGPEGREWAHYEIQVIGNIWENPELLKDETKS